MFFLLCLLTMHVSSIRSKIILAEKDQIKMKQIQINTYLEVENTHYLGFLLKINNNTFNMLIKNCNVTDN